MIKLTMTDIFYGFSLLSYGVFVRVTEKNNSVHKNFVV